MATKLKIVDEVADIVPAPKAPEFDIAPTRRHPACFMWCDSLVEQESYGRRNSVPRVRARVEE